MSGLSQQRAPVSQTPTSAPAVSTNQAATQSNQAAQQALGAQPSAASDPTPTLSQAAVANLPPAFATLPKVKDDPTVAIGPAKPKQDPVGDKDASKKDDAVDTSKVTGIATKVAIGRFITATKAVEKDWGTLTPENRAKKVGAAANSELNAVSVPSTGTNLKDLGSTSGEFAFTTWDLDLGKSAFEKTTVTKDDMSDVADTVYHESRHCEQWFRMARLVAGQGKNADAVAKSLFIPKRIADEAVKQKLDPTGGGKDVDEAKEWHKSVYGTGSSDRNQVITGLTTLPKALEEAEKKLDDAEKAYKEAAANPQASDEDKADLLLEWQEAYAEWEEAKRKKDENYQAYRNLPEEKDAWSVGDSVAAAYKK